MSSDFLTRTQKSVYDTLLADSTFATAVGSRLYDYAPETTAFPYVTFESEFSDFSTHTFDGVQGTIQINVWSQKPGRKETHDILGYVYNALHNVEISVTNYKTVLLMFENTDTIKDVDGKTHHGIMRFRLVLSETV